MTPRSWRAKMHLRYAQPSKPEEKMGRYANPKFRTNEGVQTNGQPGTILRICKRRGWASTLVPEYRVKLPGGQRVVPEGDLAPAPKPLKSNGQAPEQKAAAESQPQSRPVPPASSGAVYTAQVVRVKAAGTAKPPDAKWPQPPLRVITYYRPGPGRRG